MFNRILILSLLAAFVFALPVFAQQPNPSTDLFISVAQNDFLSVLMAIVQILLGIVGLISVFYMVIGGFQYLTSGLNSDLAERGKKTLRSAIIGLIIVILSYIIVTVVVNSFYS